MNILEKITAHKREVVRNQKDKISFKTLEKSPYFKRNGIQLKPHLKVANKTGIIAEFKRQSPSKGMINAKAQVEKVTKAYEQNGASALSVLTDTHFFGGKNEDLTRARKTVDIPILRKDFIIDEYQIVEAKAIGADVILLIAECLSAQEIRDFTRLATNLDLEVLLEMHSEKQLDKIAENQTIIGINNRDLTTFKVDIDRSIALSQQLPQEIIRIAESGINNPALVQKMQKAGFDGFLMGKHFMKTKNPGKAFREFATQVQRSKSVK